jgi:release factor glutamine methyltransferase
MTVRALLAWGEERLQLSSNAPSPAKDTEWLLRHVLGREKAWLLTHGDDEVEDESAQQYATLIKRRATGEPMQYIIGECEFFGMPFRVTPDVLIPRPETEHLVEKVVELAIGFSAPRVIDVGTGSGAIAIAIAKQLPQAQVTATDLSEGAIEVARENAARNGASVRFLSGDLLAPVAEEKFEIIASNPPYVPSEEKALLAVEVRDHEPEMALYGGADGLGIYRRLIPAAFAQLTDGGWLLLEMGFGQAERVKDLMEQAGFREIEIVTDLQGIERILCGRKKERE